MAPRFMWKDVKDFTLIVAACCQMVVIFLCVLTLMYVLYGSPAWDSLPQNFLSLNINLIGFRSFICLLNLYFLKIMRDKGFYGGLHSLLCTYLLSELLLLVFIPHWISLTVQTIIWEAYVLLIFSAGMGAVVSLAGQLIDRLGEMEVLPRFIREFFREYF